MKALKKAGWKNVDALHYRRNGTWDGGQKECYL